MGNIFLTILLSPLDFENEPDIHIFTAQKEI